MSEDLLVNATAKYLTYQAKRAGVIIETDTPTYMLGSRHEYKQGDKVLHANRVHQYVRPVGNSRHLIKTSDGYVVNAHSKDISPYNEGSKCIPADHCHRCRKSFDDCYCEEKTNEKSKCLIEGAEEHELYKDHTKNPYHDILTKHGFVHKSTEHKQNRFNQNNPKADYTEHVYTHPKHGKSHVIVTQDHSLGGGGYRSSTDKGHSFLHRHEQENKIMAPASGNSKGQLHRSLSFHYGVPKGMEPPKSTAWEKAIYGSETPKYKMNDESEEWWKQKPVSDLGFNTGPQKQTTLKQNYPKFKTPYKPVPAGHCHHCRKSFDDCNCEEKD